MFNSVRDITNKIIEIEKDKNLLSWNITGVHIWEIIRYKIYLTVLSQIEQEIESRSTSTHKKLNASFSRLIYKFNQYRHAIIFNPFFDFKKADVLVFESSRKLLLDQEYIDPYTKFLCDELDSKGIIIIRYQSAYSYDKLAKKSFKTKHLDSIQIISNFINRFIICKLPIEEVTKIKVIERIFASELELKINLVRLIKKEITLFKINTFFFNLLLKTKKAKTIYIVNFCDKPALIAMAKKNQIQVIDIQHGLISSNDLIYHYPKIKEGDLKYFPDQFYIWDKIWCNTCSIPLEEENIIHYGNKYLDYQKNKYSKLKKNNNQLLIISQPGLTRQIARFVIEEIDNLKSYNILYKLHPNEYSYAFSYLEFKKLAIINNISFIEERADLYQIFAETKYVLGVYSTALVEAISFNCLIFILDLPGMEMMTPFIDNTKVIKYDHNLQRI
jgi:hypothetical protein